jgi:hypothetical protein
MEMEYLNKNIAGNQEWESSFLGQLLEYNIWDKDEFWRLHAEITRYSREIAYRDCLPRDIAAEVSRIIQLVMQIYAAHRDQNDLCNIANLADDELYDFIERIEWMSLTFFTGQVLDEDRFGVKNPYLLSA